jgi:hypothetical protein
VNHWILSKSGGYYEIMADPMDWDKLLSEIREHLDSLTDEERFEASRRYLLERYAKAIR